MSCDLMANAVNIHEAKTHFSKLVQRAAAGEEIVISRGGVPMARLVPLSDSTGPRRPGALAGAIRIAGDFDEVDPTLLDEFESSD